MVGSIYTWTFRGGVGSPVRSVGARAARFMIRRRRLGGIWISSSIARCCTRARRGRRVRSAACARRRRHGLARDRVSRCCLRPMCWRWPSRCRIANAAERLGEHDTRLWRIVEHYVWRAVEKLDLSLVGRIAADETSARRGHDTISLFVDMARRKVVYVADGKDAATVKELADFLEAHGGRREAVTDASIDMGAAFEAG